MRHEWRVRIVPTTVTEPRPVDGRRAELRSDSASQQLRRLAVRGDSLDLKGVVQPDLQAASVRSAMAEGFTHVAFGDLSLEDVRQYREPRLAGTGLTPIFPLWLRPTATLARDMLTAGLKAYLTCVDPRAVPASFAGRRYDAACSRICRGTDACGERGEFHTCAVAGPMFARRLDVTVGPTLERDGFVFADLRMTEGTEGAGHDRVDGAHGSRAR